MEKLDFIAGADDGGKRIDIFISEKISLTRSAASKLCENGYVLAGGRTVKKNHKLLHGESVTVTVPDPEKIEAVGENIDLDIIYEDDDVILINKPQGMVVHPAAGNYSGTLVNAVLYHCGESLSGINGKIRPGIVHRIDKDTSGILIIAKNDEAHISLSEQWKQNKPDRKYVALVHGNIKEDAFTVNLPIGRSASDRKKMAVVPGGRNAVTHVKVLERFGTYTLVECALDTGRTHQIRVHMSHIHHPIAGDKVYGVKKEEFNLSGQLLHAKSIGFVHPKTGEKMYFEAPLPGYFERMLASLRRK